MQNHSDDLFPTPGGDGTSRVAADLSLEDLFKNQVRQMLRSHPNASGHEVIKRVETIFGVVYTLPLIQWEAERKEFMREEQLCNEEAAEISEKIKAGAIPEHLENEQQYALPVSPCGKLAFFLFMLLGVTLAAFEWVNFGWFLRFVTDSFLMGLAWALPVLVFSVLETFIVRLFPETKRRRVAIVQGILGLVSAITFVWLSLNYAEGSLFEDHHTISWIRMGFQILTSVMISAMCLDAACRFIRKQPQVNPEFKQAKAKIETLEEKASGHRRAAAQKAGNVEQAHAVKADVIQGAAQKHSELSLLRDYNRDTTNQILNDKFI